ncbi:MAG: hypothetical protein GXY77_14570 [Fibrobacter sp.]|nr:hypothetical protein [Fibrobacter sp.]
MEKKVCEHCRCTFFPSRSNQKFCTNQTCRRSRKRQWQSKKVRTDKDYLAAQKEVHARWLEKNPDYYRNYRKRNPAYTRRNQLQQRVRNRCRRGVRSSQLREKIAKMEAKRPVVTGIYQFLAVGPDGDLIAKMDASYVQLTELQTLTICGP